MRQLENYKVEFWRKTLLNFLYSFCYSCKGTKNGYSSENKKSLLQLTTILLKLKNVSCFTVPSALSMCFEVEETFVLSSFEMEDNLKIFFQFLSYPLQKLNFVKSLFCLRFDKIIGWKLITKKNEFDFLVWNVKCWLIVVWYNMHCRLYFGISFFSIFFIVIK